MLYYLLDGARCGGKLDDIKAIDPGIRSLYRGRSEESLTSVAPYILTLSDQIQSFISKNGLGLSWGIALESPADTDELFMHFRKFLIVQTEDYKQLYFRFYDPRVLRVFLPTCDGKQLAEFFGPVRRFYCESEDPSMALIFSIDNKVLKTESVSASSIYKNVGSAPAASPMPSSSASHAESSNGPTTSEGTEPQASEIKPRRRFIFGS